MLRVGFLGCGFIARYHALQLALSRTPCEVVACHDPDPLRAAAFVSELTEKMPTLGVPVTHPSAREVLASVDAVFVCTWTAAHLAVVREAAELGVPVFCEKPLGVDLADATAVAEVLSLTPVHMVGLVLRSSPALLALRELLRAPGAGRIMNVVFRDDQYLPVGGMYGSDWRADPLRAGSGALLEHSIHDLDLLEWLAGPIAAVSAHQASFHGLGGIEDSVSAIGRFGGGGSFTLASVWHDVNDRASQRRIEVFCERRLVTLEGDLFGPVSLQSDDASLHLDGDELVDWLTESGAELVSAETRFLEAVVAVSAGEPIGRPHPDAEDALRAHRVVDAMYRSAAADGTAVALPAAGA